MKSLKERCLLYLRLSLFAFVAFPAQPFNPQVTYPIPELGHCTSPTSCYEFCEIREHTPMCWSYGTYIMKKDVLGETTPDIPFPISELGNCANMKECTEYCNVRENREACTAFGRSKGLVKETPTGKPRELFMKATIELGCKDAQSCKEYCDNPEHSDICVKFAQNTGLIPKITVVPEPTIPQQIFIAAREKLGCFDRNSCAKICDNPSYKTACNEFAMEYKITKSQSSEMPKTELLKTAQREFGCTTVEQCAAFCSKAEHQTQCVELAERFGKTVKLEPTSIPQRGPKMGIRGPSPTPVRMIKQLSPEEVRQLQLKGQGPSVIPEKKYQEYYEDTYKESQVETEYQHEIYQEPTKVPTPTYYYRWTSPTSTSDYRWTTPTPTLYYRWSTPTPTEYYRWSSPTPPLSTSQLIMQMSGCTTADGCRYYCETHPGECPGFPSVTPTKSPTPYIYRTPTSSPYIYRTPTPTPYIYKTPTPSPYIFRSPTPTYYWNTSGSSGDSSNSNSGNSSGSSGTSGGWKSPTPSWTY